MAYTLVARALGNQLSPQPDRFANGNRTDGTHQTGSWKVEQQASPNMSVRVGSGTPGDLATVTGAAALSGKYIIQNQDARIGDGNADVSIANGGAQDRIDLVVLRVYDDAMDSSGSTEAVIEVVQGTEAASPAAPAVPAGAIPLAEVYVSAGESTSIVTGDITDRRYSSYAEGTLVQRVVFTASGTFTKADYPYLRKVRVRVVSGGGGGGGAPATGAGEASAGAGGSGGGYGESLLDASVLAASETVTVGAGGAGGSGAAGSNGGASSFGSGASLVSAAVGRGGGILAASSSTNYGGAVSPFTGGTADLSISGCPGEAMVRDGANNTCRGGTGGASMLGPGGHVGANGAPGNAPVTGYGGGGSGASARNSEAAKDGGDGADGVVILDLYA